MYTKDKNHRITLRLNDDQFEFVKMNAEMLDVSPSDFLRMVINTSMFSYKAMAENNTMKEAVTEIAIETKEKLLSEGIGRENDEANQYDIVQH